MTYGGFAVRNAPDVVGTSLHIAFKTPPIPTMDGSETKHGLLVVSLERVYIIVPSPMFLRLVLFFCWPWSIRLLISAPTKSTHNRDRHLAHDQIYHVDNGTIFFFDSLMLQPSSKPVALNNSRTIGRVDSPNRFHEQLVTVSLDGTPASRNLIGSA